MAYGPLVLFIYVVVVVVCVCVVVVVVVVLQYGIITGPNARKLRNFC